MKTEITLLDIKTALRDANFRSKLPEKLKPDIQKFLQNPSCTCNFAIYEKVMREAKDVIQEWFPDKNYKSIEEKIENISRNNWTVINCSIGELESRLKKLPAGRKQIAISRFEDQVTVIVNELDVIY